MAWTTEAILALLRTVLPHAPERFVLEHDGLRLVIGEGTTSDPAPGTVMPTAVMSAVPTSAQAAAAQRGWGRTGRSLRGVSSSTPRRSATSTSGPIPAHHLSSSPAPSSR
jgi:hypothetical protein